MLAETASPTVRRILGPTILLQSVIFDGVDKPFINEGICGRLWPGEPRRITAGEEADLRAGAVTLDELAARYPAALVPMGAAHG